MNIGFIGLGVMGNPMAQNLQRCGQHQLSVYDIDASRCASLGALGARLAADVGAAVQDADVVMTSLPGPQQIEALALGDTGMIAQMQRGSVWIDLSTNNLVVAEKIRAAAAARAIDLLDAPVSGGDEGARAGNLTILVGGAQGVFERCLPILDLIGERVTLLGAHGAGYSAKIAQVVLCYLHSLALSEALMLGVKGGVEPRQMLDIIQHSTGSSYVAERYGPPILNGDYDPSFSLGLAHKDMKLALEMAASLGIRLPLCELTTDTYARASKTYGFDANHLRAVRLLEEDNNSFLQA
jgi:3-hydroxyisobutyrate dehydrogenase-like beta-hydroxyacid dehydrogenase